MADLQDKICVIIPTYNNDRTLRKVIEGVLNYVKKEDIIIVNDGSTDGTSEILSQFNFGAEKLLKNEPNQGKGVALRKGFKKAHQLGYDYAITIDSDGQHYPEDLPLFFDAIKQHAGAVIMGSRSLGEAGAPRKSSFGNKFSNFWFKVETGISLPDTQTGYRAYPLHEVNKLRLFTRKFETEIEVIVKLAWNFVAFHPIKIQVKYDMEERVSHFRPFKDFFRISLLNTYLCTLAFLFYIPRLFFHNLKKKGLRLFLKELLSNPAESPQRKALSVGFGFFMGIVPIWGFQLLIGIPLAILFRMNKVLFIAAANISIPPMIPIIVFVSYWFGSFFVDQPFEITRIFDLDLDAIYANFKQYVMGAIVFAIAAFALGYLMTFFIITLKQKKPSGS